jgi:uncharacterized membrane protein HdeD (DUF308 family)
VSIAEAFFGLALCRAAIGSVLLFITAAVCLMLAVWAVVYSLDYWHAFRWLARYLAVGLLFRGAALTVAAIIDRDLPGGSRYILLGVISLIAGVVLFSLPLDSLTVLSKTAGLSWAVVQAARGET